MCKTLLGRVCVCVSSKMHSSVSLSSSCQAQGQRMYILANLAVKYAKTSSSLEKLNISGVMDQI